jgi:hypothetical protein
VTMATRGHRHPRRFLSGVHRFSLLALGVALVSLNGGPAFAKKAKNPPAVKRILAVAPFKLVGVGEADGLIIGDALRSELTTTETFKVVDRAQMEQILGEQRFQLLGVTNETEAVKLGRILNAQEMVFGNLSKLGKTLYLTATAISIETAEVKASQSVEAGSIKKLRKRLPEVAEVIAAAYQPKKK